jgi:hypothetical protein
MPANAGNKVLLHIVGEIFDENRGLFRADCLASAKSNADCCVAGLRLYLELHGWANETLPPDKAPRTRERDGNATTIRSLGGYRIR